MILFEEATRVLENAAVRLQGTERIGLETALGRVLAEDVLASTDLPAFNISAMDGYACKMADLGKPLRVTETIVAGKFPANEVKTGECSKIMTGAAVPKGADCVVMVEHTKSNGQGWVEFTGGSTKSNIRYKGEESTAGDKILGKGAIIRPAHIGILAALGKTGVLVSRKLRVGVISTGSELVEPGEIPENGKIRNSNAYQLLSQLKETGVEPVYWGIVPDEREKIKNAVEKSLDENDGLLVSGGVSMGDYDFVPAILEEMGVELHFHKIKVKPGKPILFGTTSNNKWVFGMPGNPVSAFVQFKFLAKPFLYRLLGHDFKPTQVRLPLGMEIKKNKSGAKTFIPVKIDGSNKVVPIRYAGSGHLGALSNAAGFAIVPENSDNLNRGDLVDVRLL